MSEISLGQVALNVKDVAKVTDFYRDVIGLPFLFSAGTHLSFFQMGAVRLMITSDGGGDATMNSVFYFKVNGLDELCERLGEAVEFIDTPHLIAEMPDHELWMAFFKDPDGNTMAFMEERRP